MKLYIDFSALENVAKKMGVVVTDIDFHNTENFIDTSFIDELTKPEGIEVDIDEVVIGPKGVFTYKGECVVLFIKDQWINRIEDIKSSPKLGKKFHFLACETLKDMKAKNRFNRYFVNKNKDGLFEVFNNLGETGIVKLNVCQNCLKTLNYDQFNSKSSYEKNLIVNNFNLKRFFEEFSSRISEIPDYVGQDKPGYSVDWDEISRKIRQRYKYICQECQVDLSNNIELCHVHHKNGVKHDNNPSNLIVLCKECHKNHHDSHMKLSFSEINLIKQLRERQGLLK